MKRLLLCLVALPIFLVGSCSSTKADQQGPLPAPSTASESPTLAPAQDPISLKPIVPKSIHILGVTAPITPVKLEGSELVPPSDPDILGWWGKMAGSKHGTTLLVGHTVHTGGGVLDDLEDVPVGDILVIHGWSRTEHQKLRYKVVYNQTISKATLAKKAQQLFSQRGAPKLVVVTCEDYNWSTGEYASNVVLMAIPI